MGKSQSKKERKASPPPISAKKKNPVGGYLLLALVVLIILGIGSTVFTKNTKSSERSSLKALAKVQSEKRIIDVHEHIQSIDQAPGLLRVMNDLGIAKTCLMGSSWFTITLNQNIGFTRYDENNESLMAICEKYPGRFEAWPTMNPKDADKLEKFQALVKRGAKGLKLYLGHGFTIKKTGQYMFHTVAIDDPGMLPVYQYCQENFIPICLHVNPSEKSTPGFAEEFVAMLTQFPDLKVVCPHFMLSSIVSNRLEELLESFPNLYSDISFGHDDFLAAGLKRISKSPTKFRTLLTRYRARFMFSCDLVITDEPAKTPEWIEDRMQAYLDMLTKDHYTTPAIPGVQLRGLGLAPEVIEDILYKNHEAFIALKPTHTTLTHTLDWSHMGIKPLHRDPGQTFPPPVLGGTL